MCIIAGVHYCFGSSSCPVTMHAVSSDTDHPQYYHVSPHRIPGQWRLACVSTLAWSSSLVERGEGGRGEEGRGERGRMTVLHPLERYVHNMYNVCACMYIFRVHVESHPRQLIFLRKSDYLGCAVLLCLVVCLTLLASFFLPSHLSLKHVHVCMHAYIVHRENLQLMSLNPILGNSVWLYNMYMYIKCKMSRPQVPLPRGPGAGPGAGNLLTLSAALEAVLFALEEPLGEDTHTVGDAQ